MDNGLVACSAYLFRMGICANGFPQKPFCRGFTDGNVPMCLTDHFAPHLMDENGRMLLRTTKEARDGTE